MKITIIAILFSVVLLGACSNNNSSSNEKKLKSSDSAHTNMQTNNAEAAKPASANAVVTSYLQLKNALANDDGNETAKAGKGVYAAIQKIDEASLTTEQKKVYDDVKDDIKENSEHISNNGDKIAHQREHFEMLSKDMYDLVKAFKSEQTLYKDHCPMYNKGIGADWLSEVKEIKNPYLGKKMPTCGSVKEEFK